MDSLKWPKQRKINMKFGKWNVGSLYRSGSLKTVASKLMKCKLDSAVQGVWWNKGDSKPADDYTFSYGNGNAYHHVGTGFFIRQWIKSAVMRAEFVHDRMSYITLRGPWYCFECAHTNERQKWWYKGQNLRGTRVCTQSVPKLPQENSVWRFQCKSRDRRNNWEWDSPWN